MSRYVGISILNPDGNPRRTFKLKSKGGGMLVEAKSGEQYGIRITNKSATKTRAYDVYVDGKRVDRRWVRAKTTYDLTEVLSKVSTVGGVTTRVYRPLIFAYPEIKEEEGHTSLPDDVAERLGCIEVKVYRVVIGDPGPTMPAVLSQEALKVAMTEEEATMKGAFRSVTRLGATERVVTLHAPKMTSLSKGKHLGDVKLHYGSTAMLLFRGVPPELFNSTNNNKRAADDDDDDEQSDSGAEPRSGGRKRGRDSGPVSLPPAPPLNSRASHKRVKTEE